MFQARVTVVFGYDEGVYRQDHVEVLHDLLGESLVQLLIGIEYHALPLGALLEHGGVPVPCPCPPLASILSRKPESSPLYLSKIKHFFSSLHLDLRSTCRRSSLKSSLLYLLWTLVWNTVGVFIQATNLEKRMFRSARSQGAKEER